jgi:hypothetical protein
MINNSLISSNKNFSKYYSYYSYKNLNIDLPIIDNDMRICIMYIIKKISHYNVTHCHTYLFNILNYLAIIIKQSISKNNSLAFCYSNSTEINISFKIHYGAIGELDVKIINEHKYILEKFGKNESFKKFNEIDFSNLKPRTVCTQLNSQSSCMQFIDSFNNVYTVLNIYENDKIIDKYVFITNELKLVYREIYILKQGIYGIIKNYKIAELDNLLKIYNELVDNFTNNNIDDRISNLIHNIFYNIKINNEKNKCLLQFIENIYTCYSYAFTYQITKVNIVEDKTYTYPEFKLLNSLNKFDFNSLDFIYKKIGSSNACNLCVLVAYEITDNYNMISFIPHPLENIYDDDINYVYEYTFDYLYNKLVCSTKKISLLSKFKISIYTKIFYHFIDHIIHITNTNNKINNILFEYNKLDEYNNYEITNQYELLDLFNNYYEYKFINNKLKYKIKLINNSILDSLKKQNKNIKEFKYFIEELLSLNLIPDVIIINNINTIDNIFTYIFIKNIMPKISEFKNIKIYFKHFKKDTNSTEIEVEITNSILPIHSKRKVNSKVFKIFSDKININIIEKELNNYRILKNDKPTVFKIEDNKLFQNNDYIFDNKY